MTGRMAWLNGEFVPERDARFSCFDSGVLYGEFAFEMTRTFRHRPFRLREHLQRLFGSLAYLRIDCGLTIEQLEQLTLETLAQNLGTEAEDVDWHIRHDISRGPAEPYAITFAEVRPTVLISCWPLLPAMARNAPLYESGVPVIIARQQTIPHTLINPAAKTRSRAHFQIAQMQARQTAPGAWPVLTDPHGYLAEGPSWNLFLVRNGTLYGPRLTNILPGVSRELTLTAARQLGIPTEERDIDREFASQADEMFCTATSFGLLPVSSFESVTLPAGCPGPVYQQLLHAWTAMVGIDFVAQSRSYAERLPAWQAAEQAAARQK